MTNMYQQFRTDAEREQKGISLNYGSFRVLIARAGGANKNYTKVAQRLFAPYRQAISSNTLPEKRMLELFVRAYAEGVILKWEVLVDEEKDVWKEGIHSPSGDILPVTVDNIVQALTDLPDLFADIRAQAEQAGIWRLEALKESAKN